MSQSTEKSQPPDQGPEVHFEHVNSMDSVKFKASWGDTLVQLWERAVSLLKEPRRPDDHVQSEAAGDLTQYLALTLLQLREQKLIHGFHFQIAGPTGGAGG